MDRGAKVFAELISSDYRRSPLVQGGLEIQCKVIIEMPGTIRNQLLMGRYSEIVNKLYVEPKDEVILGSFLTVLLQPELKRQRKKKVVVKKTIGPIKSLNIRRMFAVAARINDNVNDGENKTVNKETCCICIDD